MQVKQQERQKLIANCDACNTFAKLLMYCQVLPTYLRYNSRTNSYIQIPPLKAQSWICIRCWQDLHCE
jgi:hypothetical protein